MKLLDILVEPFIKLWEVEDEIPKKVDVIIGIGTGLKSDGSCSPQSEAITEKCAVFWRQGLSWRSKIIFTSGNSWGGPREAEAMRDFAIELGVLKEDIIIVEAESKNTRENAIAVFKILEENSRPEDEWIDGQIVAYRLHARKVRDCFRKVFEPFVGVHIAKAYADHDPMLPQKRLRSKTRFFIWELLSYIIFKFKGWA